MQTNTRPMVNGHAATARALALTFAMLAAAAPGASAQVAWQLVETIAYDKAPEPPYRLEYGPGVIGLSWGLKNDRWSFVATWTQPPETIRPGVPVTLTISVHQTQDTGNDYSAGGRFDVFFDRPDVEPGSVSRPLGFTGDTCASGHVEMRHRVPFTPVDCTISATLSPGRPGDRQALIVAAFNGRIAGTKYVYEWREPVPKVEPPPRPPRAMPPPPPRTSTPGPGGARDSGARFSSIQGQVEVFHANETRADARFAHLDTVLYAGDHIVTDDESTAIVGFSDLTTYKLTEDAEVVITTAPDKDSKIGLVMGNIWVNVKKMWKDGTMEVEMSQAVTAIKGTTLVLEATPDVSVVKVVEGLVDVRAKTTGEHVAVGAGEMVKVTADGVGRPRPFAVARESAVWAALGPGATGAATNIARRGTATQSSTDYGGDAARAIDGDTSGAFPAGSVTHTALERQPWWQVDLGASFDIDEVVVWNREDCCSERLASFSVVVSEAPIGRGGAPNANRGVWRYDVDGPPGRVTRVPAGVRGRYVRITLPGRDYLSLAEVEVRRRP